jgi:hypothetical protein
MQNLESKPAQKRSKEFDELYRKAEELKIAEPTAVKLPEASIRETPPIRETPAIIKPPAVTQSSQGVSQGQDVAPITLTPAIPVIEVRGSTLVPNTVLDCILPQLSPVEQLVYLRLYRLSHGFKNDTCLVSVPKLAKSCQTSASSVIRAIRSLETKGLVLRIEAKLGGKMSEPRGNHFEVYNPPIKLTAPTPRTTDITRLAGVRETTNKEDDDPVNKDHHQRATMTAYRNLTGNEWTKTDERRYKTIQHIPLDQLEQHIRTIHARASERIGSFAYFAKAILAETSNTGKQSPTSLKKKYTKMITELRSLHIGAGNYRLSDLAADLKERCAREGLRWDDDVFNDIVG